MRTVHVQSFVSYIVNVIVAKRFKALKGRIYRTFRKPIIKYYDFPLVKLPGVEIFQYEHLTWQNKYSLFLMVVNVSGQISCSKIERVHYAILKDLKDTRLTITRKL